MCSPKIEVLLDMESTFVTFGFCSFFVFFLNLAILGIEITAPHDSFLVSSSRNPTVSIWARPQYLEAETQCMVFSKGEQSYSELFHTLWWCLGFFLNMKLSS